MIHYTCEKCGEDLEVDAKQCGKPAECHKCHNIQNVPLPKFLPRVSCPNCEHELSDLTEEDAGKIVKCPKCHNAVRAPEMPGSGSGCAFTACFVFVIGCTASFAWWRVLS